MIVEDKAETPGPEKKEHWQDILLRIIKEVEQEKEHPKKETLQKDQPGKTKFCFECGKLIKRAAKFCEWCGARQPDI